MKYGNVRDEAERARLIAKGFKWVTVLTRGEQKGLIRSAHRTYDAANAIAKGTDRTIVEIAMGDSF